MSAANSDLPPKREFSKITQGNKGQRERAAEKKRFSFYSRNRKKIQNRETGDSSREKQLISRQSCDKRQRDSEKEREIKRGASGCQVDQNKHWVPCRQRACFSQTDTKLDPLLSSSKQQQHQVWTSACVCFCLSLTFPYSFFSFSVLTSPLL